MNEKIERLLAEFYSVSFGIARDIDGVITYDAKTETDEGSMYFGYGNTPEMAIDDLINGDEMKARLKCHS